MTFQTEFIKFDQIICILTNSITQNTELAEMAFRKSLFHRYQLWFHIFLRPLNDKVITLSFFWIGAFPFDFQSKT